ncbi:MAG: TetR/AcrR family transcriptional regulator [Candidatus Dormibacteraeota bacterium]|nr:TetR/AcrR family transcriptional regulator [Candidatus Dormibacteraeota bacterium]
MADQTAAPDRSRSGVAEPAVEPSATTVERAGEPARETHLRADAVRNRERLLAAAAAAFAERGAEVPLEDIARGAGVGIGTLYRHFPTRDALVEAVYTHEVDVLCERADELLAELPPDQALAQWMDLFVRHVHTKRGMLSVLKPMMAGNSSLAANKGRAQECATRLLAAGVAAGTVRDDIEGADLMRAVGGICMSTATDQDTTRSSERLVKVIVDGLRATSAARD